MSVDQFDPETAPLEELKARINAGIPEPEQKRNADGTFAPKTVIEAINPTENEVPAEKYKVGDTFTEDGKEYEVTAIDADGNVTASEEVEPEVIYQRRIDLGDGSGVQVFSANSMEELVDKLVAAQENATRKIREMAARQPKPQEKPRQRTADEEFVLSQELMSKPTAAFEKLFEQTVGMPISEFKTTAAAVKAFNAGRAADEAATKFVEATPDYYANPSNGKKIQAYLKTHNLPATVENLTKAYSELKNDGLLQDKPKETPTTSTEVTTETSSQPVIQTPQRPKPRSSGLSARGGTPQPIKRTPVTQDDFERETAGMSLAEIRARANAQAHVARDPHDF